MTRPGSPSIATVRPFTLDTVTILRDLWHRRLLVVAVAIVAVLAGMAVVYKVTVPPTFESRKYEVGVATASILVDTPNSQVVEVAPKGSDTLGVRANLLASLMTDGEVKAAIARGAGLDPDDLVASSTSTRDQAVTKPKSRYAPMLTTSVVTDNDGVELPIIGIEAQARDATTAAKLADAAVVGLRDYLDSTAAAQRIPDAKRLKVSGLGETQAQTVARGPKNLVALAVVLLVFGLGCAAILAGLALRRGWRAAVEAEDRQAGDPDQLLEDEPTLEDHDFVAHPGQSDPDVAGERSLSLAMPSLVTSPDVDEEPRVSGA